jgi:hypothetical protein
MVIGTGGGSFTVNAVDQPFDEEHFYQYGYARITAHNSSVLTWEFINISGTVSDQMTIVQDLDAILASHQSTHHHHHNNDSNPSSSMIAMGVILIAVGLSAIIATVVTIKRERHVTREYHSLDKGSLPISTSDVKHDLD